MLTIERMYELARREAWSSTAHPACDLDDLVQCAVIGMVEASVTDEALAVIVARRRIVDEMRRVLGRIRPGSSRTVSYLFQPLGSATTSCLADVLADDSDPIGRVEITADASRDAEVLMRAIGRRAGHALVWHIVEERGLAEIAARYGVTAARVSQILGEAVGRARRVHEAQRLPMSAPQPVKARHEPGRPARPARSHDRDWLEATAAEKRAFGDFRRLQRAGLGRQQALAILPEARRVLVESYQRKTQRRARARAAGEVLPLQTAGGMRRYESVDEIVISPEERAAAREVSALTHRGMSWRDAVRTLSPITRARAESYNVKMRARSRVRARLAG